MINKTIEDYDKEIALQIKKNELARLKRNEPISNMIQSVLYILDHQLIIAIIFISGLITGIVVML